jgi:hypothetical protein
MSKNAVDQIILVDGDRRDIYKQVRERKGYGWENLNDWEKSDKNFGTFLRRNFEERQQMELQIVKLSPMQLYLTMEWLEPLTCKLFETIESFIRA